jgi:hypothetical protein
MLTGNTGNTENFDRRSISGICGVSGSNLAGRKRMTSSNLDHWSNVSVAPCPISKFKQKNKANVGGTKMLPSNRF